MQHRIVRAVILAALLGGVGAEGQEQPLLNPNPPVARQSTADKTTQKQTGKGRVKGTLTFFFNENYGEKPDTGSRVALIKEPTDFPKKFNDFPSDQSVDVSSIQVVVGAGAGEKRYEVVASSVADGDGNYVLSDVPPGFYTLVAQSSHVLGKLERVLVTTDKRGKPLKHPYTEMRPNQRDLLGRVYWFDIEVQAGSTIDVSHDFGMSTF
jgi:hypothetical protein